MRRVLAPLPRLVLACAVVLAATAQTNPPVPPPSGPVNPPGNVVTPVPSAPPSGTPSETPLQAPTPEPGASPPTPAPLPSPTQPPIFVDPPQLGVEPERRVSARINSALGPIAVVVADPAIADAVVDQEQRVLYVGGRKIGTTTVTLTDARGVSRTVPVRVAYNAGIAADETTLRVTGDPASPAFLREALAAAVTRAARPRPGASVRIASEGIAVSGDLRQDDVTQADVPLTIAGPDYFTVSGTTRVRIENDALPPIRPVRLLVSDYPERLTSTGTLFSAHLDVKTPQRFLYYHYNPGTEPARRIVLLARNASNAPATVQMISGIAGPEKNEMEVGHLSTQRFLVHEARNEGTILTIAPGETAALIDHPLPPQNVVSGILQLRLVNGDPLELTLIAADANGASVATDGALLTGGAPHARGVYPVPTFYIERTYDVDGADLEIPLGQLPLPNLREGQALAGDYGVEQSLDVVIVNRTRDARPIALYANPRGGKATGTFLIDGTLVQAHGLAPFSKYKLWQETIAAGTFRRIRIVTMPEGGSSYPLRLIFAPDDGSVAPFAPGSPVY